MRVSPKWLQAGIDGDGWLPSRSSAGGGRWPTNLKLSRSGYGQAHTVDMAPYPATRHNGYSNDFRTHTSLAPELRRMELKDRRSARTATVAKRLVFRLSRISKLTQLRAQSVTSRRSKGPRVIPTPLGSLALQKNQRRP
ncbi:hypothetical protein HID58_020129 [Brassica napus]|uniref:Uncharacterized protein n=1 Tax=Brassica napus TaxID=3708 RepID=A0ABQ8DFB0_BRANA|nr:hypothetical protein HID58_020129 [Brassica napus]